MQIDESGGQLPDRVFFKFFRLFKIENTGEQELARAREKSTGQYEEFPLSFSDSLKVKIPASIN
jgi:hypothetical protein